MRIERGRGTARFVHILLKVVCPICNLKSPFNCAPSGVTGLGHVMVMGLGGLAKRLAPKEVLSLCEPLQVMLIDLMVVQIGFSVWAGTATPPPVGCPHELYKLMGNFSFV